MRKSAAWLTAALSIGYLVLLVAGVLVLRFVGERWWLTAVGLYLPRFPLAVPPVLLIIALLLFGPRRLIWTQGLALLVVIFPLMGFVLPGPTLRRDAPVLRVLSYNVNSCHSGLEKVAGEVLEFSADVVLLQELRIDPVPLVGLLERHYPHVLPLGEFLVASRYPILSTDQPEKLIFADRERSPRFLQHVIDTPLGKLVFYNVHPISPRAAFYKLRGQTGLKRAILSGEVFVGEGKDRMMADTGLLATQIRTVAERAGRERDPVVIVGDLNLPNLSLTWHRNLAEYQDGFAEAGWGFGHTYPNREGRLRMWMRLDKVLAGSELMFVDFEVGCENSSDHFCVVAELQRRGE